MKAPPLTGNLWLAITHVLFVAYVLACLAWVWERDGTDPAFLLLTIVAAAWSVGRRSALTREEKEIWERVAEREARGEDE